MQIVPIPIDIPKDILRHVCMQFGPETNLAARFGLTSKLWYREVWRWQTEISASSPEAALSLSKRKTIIDSQIKYLKYNTNKNEYYSGELEAFLNRFLPGTEKSLKSLHIVLRHDQFEGTLLKLLAKVGEGLERLSYRRTHNPYFEYIEDVWTEAISIWRFKNSLKILELDMSRCSTDLLLFISKSFPNLEEASFVSTSLVQDNAIDVWNAFVKGLPKLRLLAISQNDKIFTSINQNTRNQVSLADIQTMAAETTRLLSPKTLRVVCYAASGHSLATLLFLYLPSWQSMETMIAHGFPFQVADRSSLLGFVISRYLQRRIQYAGLNRILQPIFERPDQVDLKATWKDLNPVQWALLSGQVDLLNSVLALLAHVPDRDIHALVSRNGQVNIFHAAIENLESPEQILVCYKLLFSRQKSLGVSITLLYQERGETGPTVIESLLMKSYSEPLLFLVVEKGFELESRRLTLARSNIPSILHAAFHQSRGVYCDYSDFYQSIERLLVSRPEIITTEILDIPHGLGKKSLLAQILRGPNANILNKALSVASEQQKNIALLEIAAEKIFFEAHEKLLLNAGADPDSERDSYNNVAIHIAADNGYARRILLMLKIKGSSLSTVKGQDGRFPVQRLVARLRDRIHHDELLHLVPAIRALLEPEVKSRKGVLLYLEPILSTLQQQYSGLSDSDFKAFGVGLGQILTEITKLVKTAQ